MKLWATISSGDIERTLECSLVGGVWNRLGICIEVSRCTDICVSFWMAILARDRPSHPGASGSAPRHRNECVINESSEQLDSRSPVIAVSHAPYYSMMGRALARHFVTADLIR